MHGLGITRVKVDSEKVIPNLSSAIRPVIPELYNMQVTDKQAVFGVIHRKGALLTTTTKQIYNQ